MPIKLPPLEKAYQLAEAQELADKLDPVISQHKASEMLGVSCTTLARWRRANYGPKPFKLGGKVRYQLSDIKKFVEAEKAKAEWGIEV